MTNTSEAREMIGRTAVDAEGNKIGKIEQIYLNDDTGFPQWMTIKTGLFGNKESFAPLRGAQSDGDDVRLAVSKDLVKDAPKLEADEHLDDADNDTLYSHYAGHLDDDGSAAPQGLASGNQETNDQQSRDHEGHNHDAHDDHELHDHDHDTHDHPTQGHDTSGPNTDDAMTRSEEQVHVGTEQKQAGRARLRKYVVTEDVTTTVPVSHEEVRVDREPITDANRGDAMSGGEITEEEHEVTLHAEEPVVTKETVPVERVKMGTETVTEDQTVSEQVRKEQIDTPDTDRS